MPTYRFTPQATIDVFQLAKIVSKLPHMQNIPARVMAELGQDMDIHLTENPEPEPKPPPNSKWKQIFGLT